MAIRGPVQGRRSLRAGRGQAVAFTATELLVCVGVIGLLIAILLPVVGRVRQSGYRADTANQIQVLQAAIDRYHQTFGAYPGPLADREMFANTHGIRGLSGANHVTMSENLVLGLLGGLKRLPRGELVFDSALVGQGPQTLNLGNARRYEPFLKDGAAWLSAGFFRDSTGQLSMDTNIPEFLDRFPAEPMPILYLRAQPGARGIISSDSVLDPQTGGLYQYDIRQILGYTGRDGKGAVINGRAQGLWAVGRDMRLKLSRQNVADALPYFKNAAQSPDVPDQSQGVPHSKDGYILISAGADRIYGTTDDITSFGAVGQ